ncbi:hypothetical protein [Mumia sp. DW29H23]|uniref:hypothetical protein n=1 Tax=Mumia sp. DW29H23 TaxID=3421241 RepID=UPI003D680D1B
MSDLAAVAIQRLRGAGVRLKRGLSDRELARLEGTFEFRFGPEHRRLLSTALPVGPSWVDWRRAPKDELRARLAWPTDGVAAYLRTSGFWPSSWGERPDDPERREGAARERMEAVPRLVPLFSHRYLTADPQYVPSPVFSVYGTDVIYYGDNLVDYVAREFMAPSPSAPPKRQRVPFWSDLAEGTDISEI